MEAMTMSEIVENRSEIVFLYDIKDGNPNGDPLDENKPRIDDETGENLVTDVRLKRTIRDYIDDKYENETIFVRESRDDEGFLYDAKRRALDFLGDEFKGEIKDTQISEVLKGMEKEIQKCIDVRLFGGTIPVEFNYKKGSDKKTFTGSITYTGPVQFKIGRSCHSVVLKHLKGTGAFADKYPGKRQFTFREEDILYYSLIKFYGIINENLAKITNLTHNDINLLLEGMWKGTKSLTSRTKAGQMPRILLKVNYSEPDYHIGDLDKLIVKVKSDESLPDEKIRDIPDIVVDVSDLIEVLKETHEKIASIDYKVDNRVRTMYNGKEKSLKECLEETGIELNEITFSGE
jgi:CRISPR-associated protein Csh2